MIYIITNHHKHDRFLNLQAKYLHRYTGGDYKVYCGLSEVPEAHGEEQYFTKHSFFDLSSVKNDHGVKMNYLTEMIKEKEEIHEDDILVFLDGDAFPIADWDEQIRSHLVDNALSCAYRTENLEPLLPDDHKPYPHLLFVAAKAKFWIDHDLSWERDVEKDILAYGPLLKFWLEENKYTTKGLYRSNKVDVHPLFFGVYGDLVYHHGSSSGNSNVYDSFDIWSRTGLNDTEELDIKYCDLDLRYPCIPNFNGSLSELVYQYILRDDNFIRNFFMGVR